MKEHEDNFFFLFFFLISEVKYILSLVIWILF